MRALNTLYDDWNSQGVKILAFPCEQFNLYEPDTMEEVKETLKKYKVKFHVFQRCLVNSTKYEEQSLIFKYLKDTSSLNGGDIPYNFSKFIVNSDGQVTGYYNPEYEAEDICERFQEFYNVRLRKQQEIKAIQDEEKRKVE